MLAKGSFGEVYRARDRKNPEFKVAIKVIRKHKMSDEDLANVMGEVDMLRKVDHPNIVQYFETYESKENLYLVMEFCPGGELLDSHFHQNVKKKGAKSYTER